MLKRLSVLMLTIVSLFSMVFIPVQKVMANSTVIPNEDSTSMIRNPAMGWVLYVDFQKITDPQAYWAAQDQNAQKASIFYMRAPWAEFEPEEGRYAWIYDDNYKALIQGALDRGLKLAFRVYTDSRDSYCQSTPDYVRQAGCEGTYYTYGYGCTNAIQTITSSAGTYYGPIENMKDGNEESVWSSALNPTFPCYITYDLGSTVKTLSGMTVVAHYGQGQGLKNVDVEYWDGSNWVTAASNISLNWLYNSDTEEGQRIEWPDFTASKFRLKVNQANLTWGLFSISEIYLDEARTDQRWTPYENDPIFRQKLEKFLDAFAVQYDNPDIVDYIDAMGLGAWGEMHHMNIKGMTEQNASTMITEVFNWITGVYKQRFKKVLLGAQEGGDVLGLSDELLRNNGYSILRRDSFGSHQWLQQDAKDNIVALFNQRVPVFAENCYQEFKYWRTPWSWEYPTGLRSFLEQVISDAKYCHANTLDLRRPRDATTWTQEFPDLVNDFLINGGYRFVANSVNYPAIISGSDVSFELNHSWKNTAVGRIPNDRLNWNSKYKVAYALLDKATGISVKTSVINNIEISDWVKGNNYQYTSSIDFGGAADGTYDLGVAIVDTSKSNTPAIKLALTNPKTQSGWYKLGDIKVCSNLARNAAVSVSDAGNGDPLSYINDGDNGDAWGSSIGVIYPQYITFDWGTQDITANSMSLVTHFGQGQGITNLDVQYYSGTQWVTSASNINIIWNYNTHYDEFQNISFPQVTAKTLRIKINASNRMWNKFAVNDIKIWNN
jgi:hypothetical protein